MNYWELDAKVIALLKENGLSDYEIPQFLQSLAYSQSFKLLGGNGSSTLQPNSIPTHVASLLKDIKAESSESGPISET